MHNSLVDYPHHDLCCKRCICNLKIFEKLLEVLEYNTLDGRPRFEHEIQIPLPGLFVKPIWCPKKVNCTGEEDFNFTALYDFQPLALQKV